jgi:hypothetical protein
VRAARVRRCYGLDADDQRYEFAGTKIDIIRQIGHEVPVATASTLVRASIAGSLPMSSGLRRFRR